MFDVEFKPIRRKIIRKPLLVKPKIKQRKLDKSKNLPPINIKVELQGLNENLDKRKETLNNFLEEHLLEAVDKFVEIEIQ
ncbi:hypothetical protein CHUAL_009731 [Chamberlinius hualienensis]